MPLIESLDDEIGTEVESDGVVDWKWFSSGFPLTSFKSPVPSGPDGDGGGMVAYERHVLPTRGVCLAIRLVMFCNIAVECVE